MMMRWPSGEKRGENDMAGEVCDDLALAGLDIVQVKPAGRPWPNSI